MTIQTVDLKIARERARELYRAYRAHAHYSKPIDDEVRRAYQLLGQGRLVIRALESIKQAGLDDAGLPKLAICRADAEHCWCEVNEHGGVLFSMKELRWSQPGARQCVRLPNKTFTVANSNLPPWHRRKQGRAIMPIIPINLRPKRGLASYHVLFEAEWQAVPPVDPILLRRIGKADMWAVVAMWELSEVEQAALAARVSA